jgi:choline kinase
MKVRLGPDGRLHRITKNLPVDQADGEYPGICLVEPEIVDELASALEETWRRTPDGYYEDGFQLLADSGADVRALALPEISWVEVDDHRDLATARELACRY